MPSQRVLRPLFVLLAIAAHTTRVVSSAELDQSNPPAPLQSIVRFTYGTMGPVRSSTFLSGELLMVTVTVAGLQKSSQGELRYAVEHEISDDQGATIAQIEPVQWAFPPFCGGNQSTHATPIQISPDWKPGKYTLHTKTLDQVTKQEQSTKTGFEVLPKEAFGAIKIYLAYDRQGLVPSGGIYTIGQNPSLIFSVAGYGVQAGKSDLSSTLTLLDKAGQPIDSQPIVGHGTPLPPNSRFSQSELLPIPMQVYFSLNLAGNFLLRLEVTDNHTNAHAAYDIPIKVCELRTIE